MAKQGGCCMGSSLAREEADAVFPATQTSHPLCGGTLDSAEQAGVVAGRTEGSFEKQLVPCSGLLCQVNVSGSLGLSGMERFPKESSELQVRLVTGGVWSSSPKDNLASCCDCHPLHLVHFTVGVCNNQQICTSSQDIKGGPVNSVYPTP
jgi:hypothetical protein